MAKIPGSCWIEGATFRYIDNSTREWYFPGTLVGGPVYGNTLAQVIQSLSPKAWWRYADIEGYAQAVLSDAPWGYWRLGESSGIVAEDSAASPHDGVYVGGITLAQEGALADGNTAAYFNGTDGNVTIAGLDPLSGRTACSIAWWVNNLSAGWDVTTLPHVGWSQAGGVHYGGVYMDGRAFAALTIGGVAQSVWTASPNLVPIAGYHHIVVTWTSGDYIRIYIDGTLSGISSEQYTGAISAAPGDIVLGSLGTVWWTKGCLDDVAIYRSKLSQQQVTNYYNLRTSTVTIVAPMTVADETGHGYHLTVDGAMLFGQASSFPDANAQALMDDTVAGKASIGHVAFAVASPFTWEGWRTLSVAGMGTSRVLWTRQLSSGYVSNVSIGVSVSATNYIVLSWTDGMSFGTITGPLAVAGTRYHIAVTASSIGFTLIVNGIVYTEGSAPWTYGLSGYAAGSLGAGLLDEDVVYDRIISHSELITHSLLRDVSVTPRGSCWVEGNDLHYIGEDDNEYKIVGPDVVAKPEALSGSAWVENTLIAWISQTTPVKYVGHTDVAYIDTHADSHGDIAHDDTPHGDIPHTDAAHDDAHTDAHSDTHGDTPHGDSHSDYHYDDFQDVPHADAHEDTPHGDVPHEDAHEDTHLDQHYDSGGEFEEHDDGYADAHTDTHDDSYTDGAHSDSHVDTPHIDEAYEDEHGDIPHVDALHSDAHSDTHDDTHGDIGHGDIAHDDGIHTDTHTDSHTDSHDDSAHVDQPTLVGP